MDILLFGFVRAIGALQPAENGRRQNGEGTERQKHLVQSPDRCAGADVRSCRADLREIETGTVDSSPTA